MARLMILIIEDNDFVRMQITKFLTYGGYDVVQAASADEGNQAIHEKGSSIQLMLVDVRMEPMDGFDFLAKVKSENIQTPAIIVTGDDNPDILSRASQLGLAGVLKKPVNKDRLLKMVERATAGSRPS
jgi:DNA-binding NtrC family response regulator